MISRSPIPPKRSIALFPLSKCMDPRDLEDVLAPDLQRLAQANVLEGQHATRLWEYGMAHYAVRSWQQAQEQADGATGRGPLVIADVGGCASRLATTLSTYTTHPVLVIDPRATADDASLPGVSVLSLPIEEAAASHLSHDQFDIVTCISVLEHIEHVRPFCRACKMVLKPGGLFFLTLDCWNQSGPDVAHYHWMRKRIYNPDLIRKLQQDLRELGFLSFGRGDWTYWGDHIYGYSTASVAMVKRS
jgi:SAM-dependent methyltransferase